MLAVKGGRENYNNCYVVIQYDGWSFDACNLQQTAPPDRDLDVSDGNGGIHLPLFS